MPAKSSCQWKRRRRGMPLTAVALRRCRAEQRQHAPEVKPSKSQCHIAPVPTVAALHGDSTTPNEGKYDRVSHPTWISHSASTQPTSDTREASKGSPAPPAHLVSSWLVPFSQRADLAAVKASDGVGPHLPVRTNG